MRDEKRKLASLYSKALTEDNYEVCLSENDVEELAFSPFNENECQLGAELYFLSGSSIVVSSESRRLFFIA